MVWQMKRQVDVWPEVPLEQSKVITSVVSNNISFILFASAMHKDLLATFNDVVVRDEVTIIGNSKAATR